MNPHLYLAFLAASIALMLMPGPNVAFIVANSLARGVRCGLVTVAGTTTAMVVQLGLTALGLSAALTAFGQLLVWLRWIGVAYLVVLGLRAWFAPPDDLTAPAAKPVPLRSIYARGVLISLTNPKTLLFYGAFFPQFIDARQNVGLQIAVLSATFLLAAVVVDSSWAVMAARSRALLGRCGRLRNRITGGLLVGAGLSLALLRRS